MQAVRPRSFWALFTGVGGAALVVLGFVLARAAVDPVALVVAVAAALLLESSPVTMQEDYKMTLSVIVLFMAVAAGGLGLAVAVGLATGVIAGWTAPSNRLIKGLFNSGLSVLEAAVAAGVFAAIAGTSLLAPQPQAALDVPWRFTIALLLAGFAASLVNAVLLAALLRTVTGVPYRDTLRSLLRTILLSQGVYVGLAAVGYVLLVNVGWLSLALLVVPLAVARQSLLTVQQQQDAFDRMVRTFVKAIELKDGYTRGHAERVSDLSVMVAESMGLSYDERQLIRYGAILHDVGKIGVSLGILCKAGPLTDDEFGEMKQHPEIGAEMLADIDFLQPALAIVHHHHERVDGRGYPAGLEGDAIPLLTRVVTAVDAFDAMTSTRSYRRALPVKVALGELQANAGTQFDAEVVEHLVTVIHEHGWEITDEPVAVAHAAQQAVQQVSS